MAEWYKTFEVPLVYIVWFILWLFTNQVEVMNSFCDHAPYLMPGLHSYRDSTRWDENEGVEGIFVLFVMFSTCSCLVVKLSESDVDF